MARRPGGSASVDAIEAKISPCASSSIPSLAPARSRTHAATVLASATSISERSAAAIACAVAYRSVGSVSSARRTTLSSPCGTALFIARGGGIDTEPALLWMSSSSLEVARKSFRPASASQSTMPAAYTSVVRSTAAP
jgi:hypothetical protein